MTPEAPEQQELFFEAVYADPEMADEDKVRWLHASAMEYWQRLEWAERRYAARDAEASAWAEQATRNADALTAARRDAAALREQARGAIQFIVDAWCSFLDNRGEFVYPHHNPKGGTWQSIEEANALLDALDTPDVNTQGTEDGR
jgi:hypothetical protein